MDKNTPPGFTPEEIEVGRRYQRAMCRMISGYRSEKKAAAARRNGKLGGRPKKKTGPPAPGAPVLPLRMSSRYHDHCEKIASDYPKTIRRRIARFRRGDGDHVILRDQEGTEFDLIDLGRGLELIARN